MSRNLANWDRVLRTVAGLGMMACAFAAPLPFELRAPLFGALSGYMLLTALSGTCLGYKLMGKSTCPATMARS